jgi:protein-tyrosine phosphatase
MARVAERAGVEVLVATPHIDHQFSLTHTEVASTAASLRQALDEHRIMVRLRGGGEIAPARLTELDDAELRALALGDGPWLLLEAPLTSLPLPLEPVVFGLRTRGHEVLLAHPERSPTFQRNPARLRALVDLGARCQVTVGSLVGRFGSPARRLAREMLEVGLIHTLASDAHDSRRRSPDVRPDLDRATHELPGLEKQLDRLTRDAPRAVLAGDPLPLAPATLPKRSWLVRRRGRRAS